MKKYLLSFTLIAMLGTSCSVLSELNLQPSMFETISALKKILNSSTFKAIKTIKDLNDSGVEGLLPEEMAPVLKTLKTVGYGDEIDKVTSQIKSVSAVAVKESEGILADAIKELKFEDAVSVVLGGEDAATEVLRQAMYASVKKRYSARLDAELEGTEALKYWPIASGAYNMFAKKKVNGSISDLLAEKAVDALFLTMGKEEKKIRNNYQALGDQVVTKVFDYYVGGKR